MSYNSFGDPVFLDSHEELANRIKDRPHTAMPDFFIGLELYIEGFALSWCDNAEQCAGWRVGKAGEMDEAQAQAVSGE